MTAASCVDAADALPAQRRSFPSERRKSDACEKHTAVFTAREAVCEARGGGCGRAGVRAFLLAVRLL